MILKKYIGIGAIVVCFCHSAFAWSDHTAITYEALSHDTQVAAEPKVRVESIDDFLRAEQKPLAALFQKQNQWAEKHIATYPPLPKDLIFPADKKLDDAALRLAFTHALRINTHFVFPFFVQLPPSVPVTKGAIQLEAQQVSLDPESRSPNKIFIATKPGAMLTALTVLATASSEPDYGMDFGVWEDSGSLYGKIYKLGKQPFGNPALIFSSQAPIHMGFYHEDAIVYKLAPFVNHTYPLLRLYQYSTLSELTFKTGHSYWGWRFMGWALHYVQDLGQPYHASLAPNMSTWEMLWINALTKLGFPKTQNEMVVLLTNRHLAFEDYIQELLTSTNPAFKAQHDAIIHALSNTQQDASYPKWSISLPVDVVSKYSHAQAHYLDTLVAKTLPPNIVNSWKQTYQAHNAKPDILTQSMETASTSNIHALNTEAGALLSRVGSMTRIAVQGIFNSEPPIPP